jgi:hypothetical protein
MHWKNFAVAATLLLWLSGAASAACMAGDKIDKTTATDAKKKIEAAGYAKVSGLMKACDNFWHGKAMKAGAAVNVVLSPQGEVMTEGD